MVFGFGKKKDDGQQLKGKEEAAKHLEGVILHAKEEITMAGLGDQKARVALVVDISGSMANLYRKGVVDKVCERALALGVNFDDNEAVDVWAFGVRTHEIGELRKQDFFGFVNDRIRKKHDFEGGTNYAPAVQAVTKKYTSEKGDPAYVMFVTDGDNQDKAAMTPAIIEAAKHGIFWQFIGLGSGFKYLETLDTMEGRVIDNANFFALNDIDTIDDNELFRRMLGEFPDWLKKAKTQGII